VDLQWHDKAWNDYLYWQSQDRRIAKKINALLKSIKRNERLGHMEIVKSDYAGWYSTRIDQANQLIFKVSDTVLVVASCRGHYE
jgi:toxin YoeB